jgi:excisionase family DNA binding protein
MNDRWMTLQEVAEYLQVSRDLIYRLAQKGKMPASKVGSQWRFKKDKVDQWMEERSVTPTGA